MKKNTVCILIGSVAAFAMAGCGSGINSKSSQTDGYTQIERLARPAVNEGLVLTNTSLNTWNTLPPSADGTSATTTIVSEISTVMQKLRDLGAGAPATATVAAMFLPDVMRIDVSKSVATGTASYNSCQGATAKPLCGGRKITDDVMDITLSFLGASDATGNTVKDNVAYADHHQTVLTTFPYLAAPN